MLPAARKKIWAQQLLPFDWAPDFSYSACQAAVGQVGLTQNKRKKHNRPQQKQKNTQGMSVPQHMGDSFTLSYTESGLNSNSSLVLSLDPLKAERLEHRLTGGAHAIPITSTTTSAISHSLPNTTTLPSSIEKEDLNSDDEASSDSGDHVLLTTPQLSHRGSDDNSNPRREDGSRSLKARRRFTKIEDDTLLEV